MRYCLLMLVLVAGLVQASDDYSVKKGVSWKGVKIGTQPLSGSDYICRESECYPLVLISLTAKEMKQYQIKSVRYKDLQPIALSEADNRLALPHALAEDLFRRARDHALREIFYESSL